LATCRKGSLCIKYLCFDHVFGVIQTSSFSGLYDQIDESARRVVEDCVERTHGRFMEPGRRDYLLRLVAKIIVSLSDCSEKPSPGRPALGM